MWDASFGTHYCRGPVNTLRGGETVATAARTISLPGRRVRQLCAGPDLDSRPPGRRPTGHRREEPDIHPANEGEAVAPSACALTSHSTADRRGGACARGACRGA